MVDTMEQQVVGTTYTYQGRAVTIGENVDARQAEALPIGSVVNIYPDPHGAPRLVEKTADGWVLNGRRTDNPGGNYRNVLWAVPDGNLGRQETVDEYMVRFRAKAWRAAQDRMGDTSEVEEIFDRLGIPHVPANEGDQVNVARKALPDGVVVMFGDPSSDNYTIFRKDGGEWKREYGTAIESPVDSVTTVIELPDGLIRTTPTPNDPQAIAMFKAKAWAEGWKLKRRHGWCEAYEQVMRDVGLTAGDSMPDFSAFAESDAWRDLPDGALLGYMGHSRWDMAVRDSNRDSGLRRVAGTSTGGLARNRWRVLWDGRHGDGARFPDAHILHVLPPGTTMIFEGTRYTSHEDGLWYQEGRGHGNNVSAFGANYAVTVVSIP